MSERTASKFGPASNWGGIREWDGSQQRAFEELCFQLRDPAPDGWRTVKTAAPDGGVEWFDEGPDGLVHGFQAKFVTEIDSLIKQARESARTVGANRQRRNVVKLTFLAPIDLPDPAAVTRTKKAREGARQKWATAVSRWKDTIQGLQDVEIELLGSGELLERLTSPGNEGRRWFFFNDVALAPGWCRERFVRAEHLANERYTPTRHLALPLGHTVDGLIFTERFRRQVNEHMNDARDAVVAARSHWRWWLDNHSEAARALLDTSTSPPPTGRLVQDLTALMDNAATTMTSLHESVVPVTVEPGLAAAAAVDIATTVRASLADSCPPRATSVTTSSGWPRTRFPASTPRVRCRTAPLQPTAQSSLR